MFGPEDTCVYPKDLTPQASRVERALAGYRKEVNPPFFVTGHVEDCPSLGILTEEPGLEDIKLQPPYDGVEELYSIAEQSQVGTAKETLFQLDARKSKEFSSLAILNESWKDKVSEVCAQIGQALAPGAKKVNAELYKLLIYCKGDFFYQHQDAQHSDRMFATLLFLLPVRYSGGEFSLSKPGSWDHEDFIDRKIPNECSWVAFYTDVRHGVGKVKEGFRVVLNYSLTFEGAMSPSCFMPLMSQVCQSAITDYFAMFDKKVLAIPLTYQYTLATLSPDFLKGIDAYIYNAIGVLASPELHFVLRFDKTKVIELYYDGEDFDHDHERVFQDVFLVNHEIAKKYFDALQESVQEDDKVKSLHEKHARAYYSDIKPLQKKLDDKYLAFTKEAKCSQKNLDIEWIVERKSGTPELTWDSFNLLFDHGSTGWLGNMTPAKEYYYLQGAIVVQRKK